ncbi:MAG: response regulator [Firmicutes bacterium]|nr:response regulator [Bacillota bacterium]
MKILIADDSAVYLQVAKNTLIEGNVKCDIILCDSGLKTLDTLQKDVIDIILLDIVMPGLTGLDTLREIRKNKVFDDIQIIMFTSLNDKDTLKECFECGANDFICKPIEPVEFIARINAAIRARTNDIALKKVMNSLHTKNQELLETIRKLEETQFQLVNKEKLAAIGELAAGIAHEINNPMGVVSSNLETLNQYIGKFKTIIGEYRKLIQEIKTRKTDYLKIFEKIREISLLEDTLHFGFIYDDIEELIKDSREGASRVTTIIQSLRKFARTEFEEVFYYYDINEIIEEVLLLVKYESKYVADIEENLCELPLIFCNRDQIGQAIMNIIVNAVQAIKSQKRCERGRITVKTYLKDEYIVIEIADDGPGIDSKIVGKIFDPFFTTKKIGEGIGLGLSVSYDIIVNKHKGELTAVSEVGKGTMFKIKLPVNK